MTPDVQEAIEEIKNTFPGHKITCEPEKQGGVHVCVHELDIGKAFVPHISWIGFLIDFQYPRSDVYPHFIDGTIGRVDGNALGQGLSGSKNWQGKQAIRVSRRSKHRDPAIDTAATKLIKVIEWLHKQ